MRGISAFCLSHLLCVVLLFLFDSDFKDLELCLSLADLWVVVRELVHHLAHAVRTGSLQHSDVRCVVLYDSVKMVDSLLRRSEEWMRKNNLDSFMIRCGVEYGVARHENKKECYEFNIEYNTLASYRIE